MQIERKKGRGERGRQTKETGGWERQKREDKRQMDRDRETRKVENKKAERQTGRR